MIFIPLMIAVSDVRFIAGPTPTKCTRAWLS